MTESWREEQAKRVVPQMGCIAYQCLWHVNQKDRVLILKIQVGPDEFVCAPMKRTEKDAEGNIVLFGVKEGAA